MTTKPVALIIMAALALVSASAQDIEYVGSTLWSGVNDIKFQGQYAYCAFENGLGVIDISNQENQAIIGSLYIQNGALKLFVYGDYAYLISNDSSIYVISIIAPDNPSLIYVFDAPEKPKDIFVYNDYAFIADSASGLIILKVNSPEYSEVVCSYNSSYAINDVAVDDGYAYLATDGKDLIVLDIADPSNPVEIGSCSGYGKSLEISLWRNYAYLIFSERVGMMEFRGLEIIDISKPHEPVFQGNTATFNCAIRFDH